jgi:hypothetical protein
VAVSQHKVCSHHGHPRFIYRMRQATDGSADPDPHSRAKGMGIYTWTHKLGHAWGGVMALGRGICFDGVNAIEPTICVRDNPDRFYQRHHIASWKHLASSI